MNVTQCKTLLSSPGARIAIVFTLQQITPITDEIVCFLLVLVIRRLAWEVDLVCVFLRAIYVCRIRTFAAKELVEEIILGLLAAQQPIPCSGGMCHRFSFLEASV